MEESVALTWKTINARLSNLRRGAAAALSTLALLFILALALRSMWVTLGLPLLAVIGFAFFQRDRKLIFAWEDRVLALWGASNLCMGILKETLDHHPHRLKNSLKAMAAGLPPNPDYVTPPAGRIASHRRLFWTRCVLDEIRLYRSAALNLALSALPLLLWLGRKDWRILLLALAPLLLLPLLRFAATATALRAWRRRLASVAAVASVPTGAAVAAEGSEDGPDFAAQVEALDWSGIPVRLRGSLRQSLGLAT